MFRGAKERSAIIWQELLIGADVGMSLRTRIANRQLCPKSQRTTIAIRIDVFHATQLKEGIINMANGYQIEDLENLFSYHAPKGNQAERYGKINEAVKALGKVILENTPPCADQTFAIRQLQLTRMAANQTIALNE